MTEAFLQYVWRHRMLSGQLTTCDGQAVIVENPGVQNGNAGPDFEGAVVTIGSVRWAGCVEVHVCSADWNAHRHFSDAAYNNVILHVVYEHDCDIRTQAGSALPVLEMKRFLPIELCNRYEELMNAPVQTPIACASRVREAAGFTWDAWLERLVVERLERKATAVSQMLDDSKGSWETACYWLTAHYFGGKANAFPFELLAKSTPLTLLARYRNDRDRIEALLLGQAGLLNGYFEDEYPRQLQTEYEALRKGFSLTPISPHLWKFFRLRPSSFPTVRISQFASLMVSSKNLFSKLLETADVKDLATFFDAKAADYWNDHYQFDKQSKASGKNVGKMLIESLLINAWLPLLFVYGKCHGREELCDRAVETLRQMNPESNNITTKWKACGVKPRNAADSQALIQLYSHYCDEHRCLDCRIGYLMISNNIV